MATQLEHAHSSLQQPGRGTSSALEEEEGLSRQRAMGASDAERRCPPTYSSEDDPFRLSSRLKSESEIKLMTAKTGGRRREMFNPLVLTGRRPLNKVQGFYQAQNERIESLLKPVHEHVRQAKETKTAKRLRYQVAVYGSLVANIVLAIVQVYAAVASGSLSLFTTMADAVLDPASNLTLLLCHRAVSKVDARKFPAGKARIETSGNICFCFLMTSVSLILIAFSLRDLASHESGSSTTTKTFHLVPVVAVSMAFFTKLALFLYCYSLRDEYSQVRILWQDHRNDLWINGLGVLSSVGGSRLRWWIDAAGAMTLSVVISTLWLGTAYGEFELLVGVAADTETQQLITYISVTHSASVLAIDTVRAWHSGPGLVVEVDVVMAAHESLRTTHDVAEELQVKIEALPAVERAYVHVDYDSTHKPEHSVKKEL